MDKEFVPYEQALDLKKLGFDEPCLAFYNGKLLDGSYSLEPIDTDFINFRELGPLLVKVPLYQQAFRWFIEKYKLHKEILYKHNEYYGYILNNDFTIWCKTNEEAELACLKKLIEIAKGK